MNIQDYVDAPAPDSAAIHRRAARACRRSARK